MCSKCWPDVKSAAGTDIMAWVKQQLLPDLAKLLDAETTKQQVRDLHFKELQTRYQMASRLHEVLGSGKLHLELVEEEARQHAEAAMQALQRMDLEKLSRSYRFLKAGFLSSSLVLSLIDGMLLATVCSFTPLLFTSWGRHPPLPFHPSPRALFALDHPGASLFAHHLLIVAKLHVVARAAVLSWRCAPRVFGGGCASRCHRPSLRTCQKSACRPTSSRLTAG